MGNVHQHKNVHQHQTAGEQGQVHPILNLARRLEQAYQQDETTGTLIDRGEILELEDEITKNPALSLPEAAIQVMLAAALIERAREDLIADTDDMLNKMERLVRSALSAVVRESGVDLSEYAGERYAPSHTDPFRRQSRCN